MDNETKRLYHDCRKAGYTPVHAMHAAKIITRFRQLESEGLVKIEAEAEDENYFDVYGEPDGYTDIHGRRVSADDERKRICEMLERDGLWCLIGYWRETEEDEWEMANSIGMNVGYNDVCDYRENWCVPDIMDSAIDAYELAVSETNTLASLEPLPYG